MLSYTEYGRKKFNYVLKGNIVYNKLVEVGRFRKVAGEKFHRAEFRIAENMRLQHDGRGNIQLLANIGNVFPELRISEFIVALVRYLIYYFFALYDFRPNSEHINIIRNGPRFDKRFDFALKKIYNCVDKNKLKLYNSAKS